MYTGNNIDKVEQEAEGTATRVHLAFGARERYIFFCSIERSSAGEVARGSLREDQESPLLRGIISVRTYPKGIRIACLPTMAVITARARELHFVSDLKLATGNFSLSLSLLRACASII